MAGKKAKKKKHGSGKATNAKGDEKVKDRKAGHSPKGARGQKAPKEKGGPKVEVTKPQPLSKLQPQQPQAKVQLQQAKVQPQLMQYSEKHREDAWFWYRVWVPILIGVLLLATLPTICYTSEMLNSVENLPVPFYAFLALGVPSILVLVALGISPYAHRFVSLSKEKDVMITLILAITCTLVVAILGIFSIVLFVESERLAERWRPVPRVRATFEAIQITSISFFAVAVIVLLLLWVQVFFFRRSMLHTVWSPIITAPPKRRPKGVPKGRTEGTSPKGSPRPEKGPKRSPKGDRKGSPRPEKGPKRSPKGDRKGSLRPEKGPKRSPKGDRKGSLRPEKGPKRSPKGDRKGSPKEDKKGRPKADLSKAKK